MKIPKPRRPRRQKAVIDRIEDGTWAVLLIGQKQIEKLVPVGQLPEGAREGTWLQVRLIEDAVEELVVDEAETETVRGRIASKLEMLRGRQQHFKPIPAAEIQDGSNQLHNPQPTATRGESLPETAETLERAETLEGAEGLKTAESFETPEPAEDDGEAAVDEQYFD